jgi:hypothetical protein
MRGQRARGFDAEAGGNAGDQHALAGKIDTGQHVVGGGCGSEGLGHERDPVWGAPLPPPEGPLPAAG